MGKTAEKVTDLKKVYIWGAGRYGKKILSMIKTQNCRIEGFIDNNPANQGKTVEHLRVFSWREIPKDFDIIIISVMNYEAVLYQIKQTEDLGLSKIVAFFDESCCNDPQYFCIIDQQSWKIELLEQKIKRLERMIHIRLGNAGYEMIDRYRKDLYQYPQIGPSEEAVDKIVNEKCSLVRYGDGEFEFMAGNERLVYQRYEPELAKRLDEIMHSKDEKLLIGIANNYGALDMYTEDTADSIRLYMDERTRKFHMSVLDQDRVYYDAYMFKCYFPYKNREDTWQRVELIKKIWANRNVVIVEGDKTRTGYGNDLFDNAKSIKRILAPINNAFDKYEEILNAALKIDKSCLVLIVLGPTANLLAYDLMKKGYQAVDIGQVDMDYEWYRVGAQKRVPIPDRYVSQLPAAEIEEVNDQEYLNQIIERIC